MTHTEDIERLRKMNNTLKHAQEWFKIHQIKTYIYNNKEENLSLYYIDGAFEFELSKDEIIYRAEEYMRLKRNNLIENK